MSDIVVIAASTLSEAEARLRLYLGENNTSRVLIEVNGKQSKLAYRPVGVHGTNECAGTEFAVGESHVIVARVTRTE